MWINAQQIAKVLGACEATAYKVIKDLKERQAEEGFYSNPKAKIPLKYFCDKMNLDVDEVKSVLSDKVA